MTNWQPIETGPMQNGADGLPVRVLLWDRVIVFSGSYWPAAGYWTDGCGKRVRPTHWMPLPSPPQEDIR